MTSVPGIQIMIMCGVEDGTLHTFYADRDGFQTPESWTLTIGRREDNDLCLRSDVFVSRQHANLVRQNYQWALHDLDSTNGTFIESHHDLFIDQRVSAEAVRLAPWQLFRIGRTWLRLQPLE